MVYRLCKQIERGFAFVVGVIIFASIFGGVHLYEKTKEKWGKIKWRISDIFSR